MHAVAVELAWLHIRQETVPAVAGDFAQIDAGFIAVVIEQAELDTLGDFREQREVGAIAAKVCA